MATLSSKTKPHTWQIADEDALKCKNCGTEATNLDQMIATDCPAR